MITAIKTGHSAITLDIGIISDTSHVPSFWKFNNSLLDDEAYLKLITDRILIWLTEISYNIDDRVQWDWIKYNIRKETTQYSKVKAKQRRERMNLIENKLKLVGEKVAEIPTIANQNDLKI